MAPQLTESSRVCEKCNAVRRRDVDTIIHEDIRSRNPCTSALWRFAGEAL